MNSQDFLTLNLVGAGAFIFWYLISRGGSQKPSKLNMKAKETPTWTEGEKPSSEPPVKAMVPGIGRNSATSRYAGGGIPKKHPDLRQQNVTKNLNVMFIYNGHSWDAYEVLGVPAGASMKTVTEAYQSAIQRSDKESLEFLETAFNAILKAK